MRAVGDAESASGNHEVQRHMEGLDQIRNIRAQVTAVKHFVPEGVPQHHQKNAEPLGSVQPIQTGIRLFRFYDNHFLLSVKAPELFTWRPRLW